MTEALDFMRRRSRPLRLVVFDCDGVLVDSEPLAAEAVAAAVSEAGWPMTPAQSQANFLGMTLPAMLPVIERHIGHPLPLDWGEEVLHRILALVSARLTMIPGARIALDALDTLGLPWRVGTNSSREEACGKFAAVGLLERVRPRLHTFEDVAHGKPAPDLYLAAAAAEGVSPAEAIVVEDSATGVRAAVAAGMGCLGFAPHSDGAELAALGAVPFHAMAELPALVQAGPVRTGLHAMKEN